MKVDETPAGRRLDALVAEKVMGWLSCDTLGKGIAPDSEPEEPDWYPAKRIPDFSTDIKAVWEEVEEMMKHHNRYLLLSGPKTVGWSAVEGWTTMHGWRAEFRETRYKFIEANEESFAATAPLAICRAALKAVGVTEVPDAS